MGMRRALKLIGRSSKTLKESPWAIDIAKLQTDSMEPDEVKGEASVADKPLMVVITQPWCKVCQGLVRSVNGGTLTRALLPHFVFTSVQGDAPMRTWQEEHQDYIP